jgi:cell division protease FtsH
VYFLLLVAIGAMLYVGLRNDSNAAEPLTISRVAQQVQTGQVSRIIVEGDDVIRVITTNGTEAESRKETATTLVEQLRSFGVTSEQLAKVDIEVEAPSAWGGVLSGALYLLPILFMGGLLWFIFRQAQGSNNAAMSFGKSRARMFQW